MQFWWLSTGTFDSNLVQNFFRRCVGAVVVIFFLFLLLFFFVCSTFVHAPFVWLMLWINTLLVEQSCSCAASMLLPHTHLSTMTITHIFGFIQLSRQINYALFTLIALIFDEKVHRHHNRNNHHRLENKTWNACCGANNQCQPYTNKQICNKTYYVDSIWWDGNGFEWADDILRAMIWQIVPKNPGISANKSTSHLWIMLYMLVVFVNLKYTDWAGSFNQLTASDHTCVLS